MSTYLTFMLDGSNVGNYTYTGDPTATSFDYDQSVYANASLSNSGHQLIIGTGGPNQSLQLFDYVVYTSVLYSFILFRASIVTSALTQT